MKDRIPSHLWKKSVGPSWFQKNESRLLEAMPTLAVIERPGRSRLLLEAACENSRAADRMIAAFGGKKLPLDWPALLSRGQTTRTMRVGRRLVVRNVESADDGPAQSDLDTLLIPAGAAFGTGDHATTAMSLRLLERISRRLPTGWRMLDAGTGSGILALAGWRFGAGKVIAIDNDPSAIRTARENARRNGIRGVKFICGDIKEHLGGKFDVIAANLYSELLAAVIPRFRRCLCRDGRLVLSGVLRRQEAEVKRSLAANRLSVLEARRRGKWVALLCSGGLRPSKASNSVTARSTVRDRRCNTKNVVDGRGPQKHLPSHR